MSIYMDLKDDLSSENGGVLVIVALAFILFLAFTALAIDVGYMMVAKNELQNAADASALAATRQLGVIYQGMTYEQQQTYVCDPGTIVPVAAGTASSNTAATKSVVVLPEDVVIGVWDFDAHTLTPTLTQPDAVQVTARRDDAAHGGPVTTFFFKIFNIQSYPVRADATAALGGQSTAEPGELQLPIGVSVTKFPDPATGEDWCGQRIRFSPTNDPDACAGWTEFESNNADNHDIQQILEGTLENAEVTADDTYFQFLGGDLSEGTFEALMAQYELHGHPVDSIYDPETGIEPNTIPEGDPNRVPLCANPNTGVYPPIVECETEGTVLEDQLHYGPCSGASGNCAGGERFAHEWATTIVVYDSDDCNPNTERVAGFAEVVVYNVGWPSYKVVDARIRCDYVDPFDTRSGGGNYGKKGSIPGLVE